MIILQLIQEHAGTCNTHWAAHIILQECYFMEFWVEMAPIIPHFQHQPHECQCAYLVKIWWLKIQNNIIITSYHLDKTNFQEISVKWQKLSIPAESITSCMFCVNLVIHAQVYDELSRRQKSLRTGGWTDIRTDRGNNNTTSVWKAKGWTWYSYSHEIC